MKKLPLDADNLRDLSKGIEFCLGFLDETATPEEEQIKIKLRESIFWTTEAVVIAESMEFER